MKTPILLLATLFITVSSFATPKPTAPESTDVILKKAYAQAAKEHKNVIVLFHASWCGWCKKMEASLNEPSIKKSFDDNYVIVWLTVEENTPEMKKTENPGAMDFMTKYHGEKSGIPFFVVMNPKGQLLADSYTRKPGVPLNAPGDNIGCPASEKEVAYFLDILKATSHIKAPQLALIANRFRKNEDAPAPHPAPTAVATPAAKATSTR